MNDLAPLNRPVTLREMAVAFDKTVAQLEGLAERHRIRPACRIAGVRCYGPREIRKIAFALEREGQTEMPA